MRSLRLREGVTCSRSHSLKMPEHRFKLQSVASHTWVSSKAPHTSETSHQWLKQPCLMPSPCTLGTPMWGHHGPQNPGTSMVLRTNMVLATLSLELLLKNKKTGCNTIQKPPDLWAMNLGEHWRRKSQLVWKSRRGKCICIKTPVQRKPYG